MFYHCIFVSNSFNTSVLSPFILETFLYISFFKVHTFFIHVIITDAFLQVKRAKNFLPYSTCFLSCFIYKIVILLTVLYLMYILSILVFYLITPSYSHPFMNFMQASAFILNKIKSDVI